MPELIEFDTERLHLRQWRVTDNAPFALLNADPRVMEFLPAMLDRAASDAMAERCKALIAERGWGLWAVEIKSTQEFIGFVGLHMSSPELPFPSCPEVGWRLAFAQWGKGYATEAARGALRVGFEPLNMPEIVSFTSLLNHRSRAVMKRLGLHEAPHTFEHPQLLVGSALRQHCLYRLSREQWTKATA